MHNYVQNEPTSHNPHYFDTIKNKPYNPFMDSGALVMTSILTPEKRDEDTYLNLAKQIASYAGNAKLGFSQANYLSLKHRGHMLKAVASMMRNYGKIYNDNSPGIHCFCLLLIQRRCSGFLLPVVLFTCELPLFGIAFT